ncbi:MAG: hypothetical protein GC168_16950 [Candidatus Hydrogenedens sp.]|nr:hypothetical protein [Candidatus Hydrogenedens sp.]
MHEWTPAAQERLDAYLAEVKAALPGDAGDPDEIVAALAEHITVEAESAGSSVVGPDAVERAIRLAGSPAEITGAYAIAD